MIKRERNLGAMIGTTTIGMGSEISFSSASSCSSSSSSCEDDDQALSGAFYPNASEKAIIRDHCSSKPESPPPPSSESANLENTPPDGTRQIAARILRRPRVASTRASEGVDPSVTASVVGKKRVRRETLPDIAKRIPVDALRPYLNMSLVSAAKALSISATTLKRLCRLYGIKRWPFRQISGIDRTVDRLKAELGPSRFLMPGGEIPDPIADHIRELHAHRQGIVNLALEGGHEHVGEKLTPTSSVFGNSVQCGSTAEDHRAVSPPCQSPEYPDHGNSISFVGTGGDTTNDVPSLRREDPLLSSYNAEMYPATPDYKRHSSSGSGTSSYLSDYRTPTTASRTAAGQTPAAAAAQQAHCPDTNDSATGFPVPSQAEALAAAAATVATQSAAAAAVANGRATSEGEEEVGRRFSEREDGGSVSSYAAIITPTTMDQGGDTTTFDGNASGFPPLRRRRRERLPFGDGGGEDGFDAGLNSPSSSLEYASEGRGGATWTGRAARGVLGGGQQGVVGFSTNEQAAHGRQLNEHRNRQYQQQCQQQHKYQQQYQQQQQLQQQQLQQQKRQQQQQYQQQQRSQQQQRQQQLQYKQQQQRQQQLQYKQQQQYQQQQQQQQQQLYRRLRDEKTQVPLVWPEHSPNLNPTQHAHATPQRSSVINATAITDMADLMGTHEPAHSDAERSGKSKSYMTADDLSSLGERGDKTYMTADDLSLLGERGDKTCVTADDLSLLEERGGKTDMTADELRALGELVFGNLELYAAATAAHANSKDAIDTTVSGVDASGRRVGDGGGGGVGKMTYTDIDSLLWDEEEEDGETGGPFAVPRLDSDWCNYDGY